MLDRDNVIRISIHVYALSSINSSYMHAHNSSKIVHKYSAHAQMEVERTLNLLGHTPHCMCAHNQIHLLIGLILLKKLAMVTFLLCLNVESRGGSYEIINIPCDAHQSSSLWVAKSIVAILKLETEGYSRVQIH